MLRIAATRRQLAKQMLARASRWKEDSSYWPASFLGHLCWWWQCLSKGERDCWRRRSYPEQRGAKQISQQQKIFALLRYQNNSTDVENVYHEEKQADGELIERKKVKSLWKVEICCKRIFNHSFAVHLHSCWECLRWGDTDCWHVGRTQPDKKGEKPLKRKLN